MLLVLEDNAERVDRFSAAIRAIDVQLPLFFWRDARKMIAELDRYLSVDAVISLDHDLDMIEGEADPGDGLDVARFLVSQPVKCAVIIHSSNGDRSNWMAGTFELAGWRHWQVAPFGDDWIEVDWLRLVKRLLKKRKNREGSNRAQ